jgi:hypothetical protein
MNNNIYYGGKAGGGRRRRRRDTHCPFVGFHFFPLGFLAALIACMLAMAFWDIDSGDRASEEVLPWIVLERKELEGEKEINSVA